MRKYLRVLPAFIVVVYLIINLMGCGNSILNYATTSPELEQNTPAKSNTQTTIQSTTGVIKVSDLSTEAWTTLQLIKSGGPFPYTKDGAIFNNYEGLLPEKAVGYYHEYTVITPGSPDRGSCRIVSGLNNEYYYTDDHYSTFKLILE